MFLLSLSGVIAQFARTFDDKDIKMKVLNKYINDHNKDISKKEVVDLFIEYCFGDVQSVKAKIESINKAEELSAEQHEFYLGYVMVLVYIDESEFDRFNFEHIEPTLSIEKVMDYTTKNYNVVLRRFMEFELDRQGIIEPEKRQEAINAFSMQFEDDLKEGKVNLEDGDL